MVGFLLNKTRNKTCSLLTIKSLIFKYLEIFTNSFKRNLLLSEFAVLGIPCLTSPLLE